MRRNRSPEYIFSSERPRHRGRRALLWLMGILLLLLIMIGTMNFVFNHQVTLARQSVTVQNLPEDLESWSILHISDLNGQEIGEGQSAIRKAIELRRYSCVVMTGDMVGKKGDVQPLLDLIALLPSDVPKMLVPGDNDPAGPANDGARQPVRVFGLGAGGAGRGGDPAGGAGQLHAGQEHHLVRAGGAVLA